MAMSIARKSALLLYLGVVMLLTGCASRAVHISLARQTGAVNNDYIDVQPGWRLTVVTPILKSGGYVLKTQDRQASNNTFTLSTGTDFVGYEVAHYAAKGQRGGRVRVEFDSAEVTKEGQTLPQPQSIAPLFQVAQQTNYLRLIYMTRISQADHNMAVVTASKLDALDALTRQVLTNPAEACKIDRRASCAWIPEGIAVRAEVRRTADGVEKWIDAPR